MLVEVVERLLPVLERAIIHSMDLRIAVAFVSRAGWGAIEPAVHAQLDRGGETEFLVSLDGRATEPEAVEAIYRLSAAKPSLRLYCFVAMAQARSYHPKLYLLSDGERVTGVVGSSNLTRGGLKDNVEVNVAISAGIQEEIVSDLYAAYGRLKFLPERIEPSGDLLAAYAEVFRLEKSHDRGRRRDAAFGRLRKKFIETARALPRPRPGRKDLVGWLDLVYDALPDGEFTNEDVYRREETFRRRFPQNLNIRAKVRQQLQVLRDLGFIEHLGKARWRKL